MQTAIATPAAAPAPFSLLDEWDGHLKFNGRAPRTLEEVAVARADYQHRNRLAEIKTMSAKLALLAPFLPALAAQGIHLGKRDFGMYDRKDLRIQPAFCARDDKLFAALIALGFREIERRDWCGREDLVTLKHGRNLIVKIDVSKPAAAPAAEAEATAVAG